VERKIFDVSAFEVTGNFPWMSQVFKLEISRHVCISILSIFVITVFISPDNFEELRLILTIKFPIVKLLGARIA
jgi:hypothetical protein